MEKPFLKTIIFARGLVCVSRILRCRVNIGPTTPSSKVQPVAAFRAARPCRGFERRGCGVVESGFEILQKVRQTAASQGRIELNSTSL
jgi:hypothetical protein